MNCLPEVRKKKRTNIGLEMNHYLLVAWATLLTSPKFKDDFRKGPQFTSGLHLFSLDIKISIFDSVKKVVLLECSTQKEYSRKTNSYYQTTFNAMCCFDSKFLKNLKSKVETDKFNFCCRYYFFSSLVSSTGYDILL